MINGEGIRCTMWVSFCSHGCEGCFNESTWNDKGGKDVDEDMIQTILSDLSEPYIKGLTLSGGDPLHKRNFQDVIKLCQRVKYEHPEKDIWLYTGYTLEQIQGDLLRSQVLQTVDVLIDGKFEKGNPTKKPFRGSDNQCRHSIVNGVAVLIE